MDGCVNSESWEKRGQQEWRGLCTLAESEIYTAAVTHAKSLINTARSRGALLFWALPAGSIEFHRIENIAYTYIAVTTSLHPFYSSNQRRIVKSFSIAAEAIMLLNG